MGMRKALVVADVVVLTVAVAYFVNLVTTDPPELLKTWAWPVLAVLVPALAVATYRQAVESPERLLVARRQAVARVLAAEQARLDATFAEVPELPLELADAQSRRYSDVLTAYEANGRAVVLLGVGGSGKSTVLTRLCVRLCREETHAVPVLVDAGTWRGAPFPRWLRDAVVDTYPGVKPKAVARWIADRTVVLLVDGLDEADKGFLDALHAFLDAHPCPVAVACRTEDFARDLPPTLVGTVTVLEPPRDRVVAYLRALENPAADAVAAVSERDKQWWDLVRRPLMLGVVAHLATAGTSLAGLPARHRRKKILTLYVDSLIGRKGRPPWPEQDVRRWLSWLARWMALHGRTEFFVDRIPAKWLTDVTERSGLRLLDRALRRVVLIAVVVGAAVGVVATRGTTTVKFLLQVLPIAIFTRINLAADHADDLPIPLAWRVRGLRSFAKAMLLPSALVTVLVLVQTAGRPFAPAAFSVAVLTIIVPNVPLLLALGVSRESRPNSAGSPPGERIRRSARNGRLAVLLIVLPTSLVSLAALYAAYGPGVASAMTLPLALVSSTCCYLLFGGLAHLEYRALFHALHDTGRGPVDYLAFLAWAQENLLLRAHGSALRFPHREIQEHLAANWTRVAAKVAA
ncbi:hypothetical protein CLV43_1059 [Umezawaea tangerina]|uniref:NACHT domain-containing protein n=2 Tax=Umezawaea tangerina TaxID=84725 RepID=A0A2T0T6H9_9PSEU|nr:hypothetical protein CLV43_1059 [Umezawaea tangerina]